MATTAPLPVDHDGPLVHLPHPEPQPRIDVPTPPLPSTPSRPATADRPVPSLSRPLTADRPVTALPRPSAADRTRGELDALHREALADRIHALVVDAEHWSRCDTPPQRAHRLQVLAARGRLADIEHALRSGIPVYLRGERLVARLVSGDTVGVYCHGDVRTMHDDADAACAALGVVTTFH
jgi:hypothetical protein